MFTLDRYCDTIGENLDTLRKESAMRIAISVLITVLVILASLGQQVEAKSPLECQMPKSLMLHSAYGEQRMQELAKDILEKGYNTITYQELYKIYDRGKCPGPETILVSIDDLSGVWLRPVFIDMVNVFISNGLTLTVGVVTSDESDIQNPKIWEMFKEWDDVGMEIASHSAYHTNLNALDGDWVDFELQKSYDVICDYLGKCPTTFILPGGNGWDNSLVLEKSLGLYRGIVSIQGPREFSGDPLVFRRIPPDNENQGWTVSMLEKSFPWSDKSREIAIRNFDKLVIYHAHKHKLKFLVAN